MKGPQKHTRTELTVCLDTGEVLREEITACEPYSDQLPRFAEILFPYIVPERVPSGALHSDTLSRQTKEGGGR